MTSRGSSKSNSIRCGSGVVRRSPGLIAPTPSTRSGRSPAMMRPCPAPVHTPTSTARSAPTASSTAHWSSMRVPIGEFVRRRGRAAQPVAASVAHDDAEEPREEGDLRLPRPAVHDDIRHEQVHRRLPLAVDLVVDRTPRGRRIRSSTGSSARIRSAPRAAPRPGPRHPSPRAVPHVPRPASATSAAARTWGSDASA